ncbi:MAG: hypothetical protein WDA07_13445 [Leucobacter sp.]
MNTQHPRWTVILVPTIRKQSWLFMIGSSLFALSAIPWLSANANTQIMNLLCFVGAWFFTAAGLQQWILSGDATAPVDYAPGKMFRAEWLGAATQSVGTVLFNVSTTSALTATTVAAQKHLVWSPDAGGSVAFLVSATFIYMAYARGGRSLWWDPSQPGWWSTHINMIGCIAFGVSAVGAFIRPDGSTADADLATWGTFIGAICFFLASWIALPGLPWNRAAALQSAQVTR